MFTLRAAVVGAGPAGFYAAAAFSRRFPSAQVDILERLPVPFGLVRYGVSPDHPETKAVTAQFSSYVENSNGRVRFFGNIPAYTPQLPSSALQKLYHVVIRATGASRPRGLQNSSAAVGAHDFLLWANSHPAYSGVAGDRICAAMRGAGDAIVLGNGNVALDVSRLLLQDPSGLRCTDISWRAIDALQAASVRRVRVIGRRGPAHAAWSTKAIRELAQKTAGVVVTCDHALVREDINQQGLPRQTKRGLQLLLDATRDSRSHREVGDKELRLDFLREPVQVTNANGRTDVQLEITEMLDGGALRRSGTFETTATDLAFVSLGYIGGSHDGPCVGWANGAARGIILAAKVDAETVISGLDGSLIKNGHVEGIEGWINGSGHEAVDWTGWCRIDAEELARGKKHGYARVKLDTIDEMMDVARGVAPHQSSAPGA